MIIVLSLLWSGNLYANQYDDFFDIFNKCSIKENKVKVEFTEQYFYKFCQLKFDKKKKINTDIGTLTYWDTNNKLDVFGLEGNKIEQAERERLFKNLILDTNLESLAPFKILLRLFGLEKNNSIGLIHIYTGTYIDHVVENVDQDFCNDFILKHANVLTEKYQLKKKNWKEFSKIHESKKRSYPNGNPIILYRKGLEYKLPDNKEIYLACDYMPYVSNKSIIWIARIEYADSDLSALLKKKTWRNYPKLNLKIIWKKITAELYS